MTGFCFRSRVFLALVVIPLFCAKSVHGVDFTFSGTVTQPGAFFAGSAVGDPFTGTLFYDPTRPDTDPDPSVGNYNMSDPFGSQVYMTLNISVGGQTYNLITPFLYCAIFVSNQPGGDTLTAGGEVTAPSSITLSDFTGTALSSDALPPSINIGNWDSGVITVRDFVGPTEVPFIGSINGTRAVPVPSVCALLALPLVSLLFSRVRQGRKVPKRE